MSKRGSKKCNECQSTIATAATAVATITQQKCQLTQCHTRWQFEIVNLYHMKTQTEYKKLDCLTNVWICKRVAPNFVEQWHSADVHRRLIILYMIVGAQFFSCLFSVRYLRYTLSIETFVRHTNNSV